jgi:hypothetical protein
MPYPQFVVTDMGLEILIAPGFPQLRIRPVPDRSDGWFLIQCQCLTVSSISNDPSASESSASAA